jgi:hypothetical protein
MDFHDESSMKSRLESAFWRVRRFTYSVYKSNCGAVVQFVNNHLAFNGLRALAIWHFYTQLRSLG